MVVIGARVEIGKDRATGIVAFDNEDGTYDIILDHDGSDLDGIPLSGSRPASPHN